MIFCFYFLLINISLYFIKIKSAISEIKLQYFTGFKLYGEIFCNTNLFNDSSRPHHLESSDIQAVSGSFVRILELDDRKS